VISKTAETRIAGFENQILYSGLIFFIILKIKSKMNSKNIKSFLLLLVLQLSIMYLFPFVFNQILDFFGMEKVDNFIIITSAMAFSALGIAIYLSLRKQTKLVQGNISTIK
jgi:hypothetical protein